MTRRIKKYKVTKCVCARAGGGRPVRKAHSSSPRNSSQAASRCDAGAAGMTEAFSWGRGRHWDWGDRVGVLGHFFPWPLPKEG